MSALPVTVLISGGGTTLKNLLEHIDQNELPIDVRQVISSKKGARGLDYANERGIKTVIASKRQFDTPEAHSKAVFDHCRAAKSELVVMAGYLEHLLIDQEFSGRVVNIHPSLIPAFSGQGYYGLRVHRAAIEYGVKLSGCTVHFVDNEFDHGPIIAQAACEVLPTDTPETLQARVFEQECQLYPGVLAAIAEKRVVLSGRKVNVQLKD